MRLLQPRVVLCGLVLLTGVAQAAVMSGDCTLRLSGGVQDFGALSASQLENTRLKGFRSPGRRQSTVWLQCPTADEVELRLSGPNNGRFFAYGPNGRLLVLLQSAESEGRPLGVTRLGSVDDDRPRPVRQAMALLPGQGIRLATGGKPVELQLLLQPMLPEADAHPKQRMAFSTDLQFLLQPVTTLPDAGSVAPVH
ncbi:MULTISPECIES: hypothetical protein [unclassified Paludibacterium]|uniref:hypothetical protein n=1 Tax=unclassified Paludibacterium TaxID=2618429 RepID=UPI001C0485FD|nr:hypothetical protein [Paludibacterium sp. B53371]BEV71858.1 hypothetical protein THUN1379_13400 [Paludibacterium sp. THUN1379]